MDYPPVYNFMTVRIASEDEQKTAELSEKIKQLTDKADSRTKIIGPGKAPVYKVKDVFSGRYIIRIKNTKDFRI